MRRRRRRRHREFHRDTAGRLVHSGAERLVVSSDERLVDLLDRHFAAEYAVKDALA